MARCEIWENCMFHNNKMPCDASLGAIYRRHYCNGDFANCARFMVFRALGRQMVPINLYPNQQDRAREIIAKGVLAT
ncbi:MAG: hypothetical protein JXR37_16010 [Kiritimatiellae bacterium]|nr:hypothetical protein [Kiritimatiellia bacterium]